MTQDTPTNSIKMYVVTNVTKINRKIYSVFKINIGRALPLRSILYFLTTFGIVFLLRHLPLIKYLFLWIDGAVSYIGIPLAVAYLLGDIGTEGRAPLAMFRSFFQYHARQRRKVNYFRGKAVPKPVQYRFRGAPTYRVREQNVKAHEGKHFVFKGSYSYNFKRGEQDG